MQEMVPLQAAIGEGRATEALWHRPGKNDEVGIRVVQNLLVGRWVGVWLDGCVRACVHACARIMHASSVQQTPLSRHIRCAAMHFMGLYMVPLQTF